MRETLLSKNFKNNLTALLLYIAGAVISLFINQNHSYYLLVWLPLAISIGIILVKGKVILPGIILASLLSHFFLRFFSATDANLGVTEIVMNLAITFGEVLTILLFNKLKSRWNWESTLENKLQKVKFIVSFSFLLPLPLISLQILNAYQLNNNTLQFFNLLAIIVAYSLVIIIFTPLIISWYNDYRSKLFVTKRESSLYFFATLLIITLFTVLQKHVAQSSNPYIFLIILLTYLIYISLNYSVKVYILSVGFFFILLSLYPLKGSQSILDSYSFEFFISFLFIVLSTSYIKVKLYSRHKTIYSLKSDYQFIEDEVNRQLIEYKELNYKLFEEIEKRGIAERELAQNQKLLSEAQEVSGIATWEFSLAQKRFKWISQNLSSPILDFNIDNVSIRTFAARIHPNDLATINQFYESFSLESKDFELELRILNNDKVYKYYLVKGRSVVEKGKISRILGLIMDINARKFAEEVLLEKEQRYKALFDSNIDPICVIDAENYQIKEVNPVLESVYGYSRSELIGQSYLVLSDQPEETKSSIAFGKQKGYYRVVQGAHRRKNGEIFYIEANLMKHLVNGVEMLFIISHDITKKREAEVKLAEREHKFRLFFESDLIGMAEISITRQFISFNKKLTSIFGYTPEELKNKTWDQLTNSHDQTTDSRLFNQVLTHEIDGYTIEKQCISKYGNTIHCKVSLKAIKSSIGNISHFIILVDDISEIKSAEAELVESRAKLRQSQAVAKLGTIRFYPGENQVSLSAEAYEILGYEKKRPLLTRQNIFKSILPNLQTRFEEQICDLEKGIQVEGDHEQAIVTPSGDVRYILINFGLTLDLNQETKEVLATMADITRIKKAEIAFQEANILKDQLFSIISHDLRSPIAAISQLIKTFRDNWKSYDENDYESILETLSITSDETYSLLENLLEWSKSQKADDFKPVKANVSTLINQAVALNKLFAESKSITIHTELIENTTVRIDVEMIKTVLRNLISNSIKFTPHSGHIWLDITESHDKYTISVKDTGVGISKNELARLFDSNYSLSTLGTNNEKGTGLGLKLVKKFTEQNGGEIYVESIPNQGSVFSFTLPKYID
jgi:PAS domain S-box-containing protein